MAKYNSREKQIDELMAEIKGLEVKICSLF